MDEKYDILVVTAHPDDEVFVSGTICLCVEGGFSVALLCATDGEGGSLDLLPGETKSRLGEIRREELKLSASMLGISKVQFLGQPDSENPDAAGDGAWDQSGVTDCLAQMIQECSPQLILTHGPLGGYGHRAHRLVHGCVMAAAQAAAFSGSIFSFCGKVDGAFFSWHFDQPGDVWVDAGGFLDRRAASLGYHQTQISYFVQPHFPRSLRKLASAAFGYSFSFTAAGRKRVPIGNARRFFQKFPIEGLVLQKAPNGGRPHFFLEYFANDHRVRLNR
jgi:LmbE family N-acetylglucosaminyl deacetylase